MLLYSASNGDWPKHVLLISRETRTYTRTVEHRSARQVGEHNSGSFTRAVEIGPLYI